MANEEKLRKTYDAMGKHYSMESFDDFVKNMNVPEARRAIYDAMGKHYNMKDSFDDFEVKLGYKGNPVDVVNPRQLPNDNSIMESKANPAKAETAFEAGVPSYPTAKVEGEKQSFGIMYGPGYGYSTNYSEQKRRQDVTANTRDWSEAWRSESGAVAPQTKQENGASQTKQEQGDPKNSAEYQAALKAYGSEEGIAAEEERRMREAGVEPAVEKPYTGTSFDVSLDPMARAHAIQQGVQNGVGGQVASQYQMNASMGAIAQQDRMEKAEKNFSPVLDAKINSEQANTMKDAIYGNGGVDEEYYGSLYRYLENSLTDEEMQNLVSDAFGYDYSQLRDSNRKQFKDYAKGLISQKIMEKAAADGADMSGLSFYGQNAIRSFSLSKLMNVAANWIGNDYDNVGFNATNVKMMMAEEEQKNHWYGSTLTGVSGGAGMAIDLMLLSGWMRYGTSFLSTPVASGTALYGPVAGQYGVTNMIRNSIVDSMIKRSLVAGTASVAKGYIDFAKLGGMNYLLSKGADPVVKDQIKNMYEDLDGFEGYLQATGQIASKAFVGTMEAAQAEGEVGAKLAVLGMLTGGITNSVANASFRRHLTKSFAKHGDVAVSLANARKVGGNYMFAGNLIGATAEAGFFTLNTIDEKIDMINSEIDQYNQTHEDQKEYVTFSTYDGKIEDFFQNVGMIVGMKVAGGHGLGKPQRIGNVNNDRAKLGVSLMKQFGAEFNARDLAEINGIGFGTFSGMNGQLVEALRGESPEKGETWYSYILKNNLVPFETARKLRLALESKIVVAGYTLDNSGKIVATLNPMDVVLSTGIEKQSNGRYRLIGKDIHGNNVLELDFGTEADALKQKRAINGKVADNKRRIMESMIGMENNATINAIHQWADENGVGRSDAEEMYSDFVMNRRNATPQAIAMAVEVRSKLMAKVMENREKIINDIRSEVLKRSGVDITKITSKDADQITADDIKALDAYNSMLAQYQMEANTDPRVLEVEQTSDPKSGTQKTGVYKGRNVFYIGDLASENVHVIDPDTGKKIPVKSSEVQPVGERPATEVIEEKVSTYDPEKGVQEGNMVWVQDTTTNEWYQGKAVKSGDYWEVRADGKMALVVDDAFIARKQAEHEALEQKQGLDAEQEGQNQLGEQAGSQIWMDVNGVRKPVKDAQEIGDQMHVTYEDGTAEDMSFDDYNARSIDMAKEQQQRQQQLEMQRQQKLAEVNALNTLEDINNWRAQQNGSVDPEIDKAALEREKLIRENNRSRMLQQVEAASLEELDGIYKENNETWKDSEVLNAIETKRKAEMQKIEEQSYQEGLNVFNDKALEDSMANGLSSFEQDIANMEDALRKMKENNNDAPNLREYAKVNGAIRAFEEGIAKMKQVRDDYVKNEQNLATIENDAYQEGKSDSLISQSTDIKGLKEEYAMRMEVANDVEKYGAEVAAKARGAARAIDERIKELEAQYNSPEMVKQRELDEIKRAVTVDDLKEIWMNSKDPSDPDFHKAYTDAFQKLMQKEKPEEFQKRIKKGMSESDKKKADKLFGKEYASIKSEARKGDAVAKKIVDAVEEKVGEFTGDRYNLTYEEVDDLFKNLNADEERLKLWNKIMTTLKGSGIRVQFEDNMKDALGSSSYRGVVRFSIYEMTYGKASTKDRAEVMLHEMAHAICQEAISYVYDYEMGRKPKYASWASTLKVTDGMREGARDLISVYDVCKKNYKDFDLEGEYGITNPHEFLAELVANIRFRDKLKKVNLWSRVMNGIMKVCGIQPKTAESEWQKDTAYAKAYAAMEKIINNWVDPGYYHKKQQEPGKDKGPMGNIDYKRKKTWRERAEGALEMFRDKKQEAMSQSSAEQREVARKNWGDDTLNLVEKIAELSGVKLRFVESVAGGKANAMISNGEILIEAGNDNPVKFLMGHEMMHHIRKNSPESFDALKKIVNGSMGELGFNDAVMKQIRKYKENHVAYDLDKIEEEVVADFCGGMVDNTDVFEKFVEEATKAGKPSVLKKLKNALDFAENVMLGLHGKDAGIGVDNLMEITNYETKLNAMKDLYTEGLKNAEKNWKAMNAERMQTKEGVTPAIANELVNAGLTQEGGVVMGQDAQDLKEATGYKTPMEIEDADYSYKTKGDWLLSFLGSDAGSRLSKEERERIGFLVDRWYEDVAADPEISGYMSYGDYSGTTSLNKDGKGPIRKNVEYKFTFDIDTTCPRTYTYLNFADQIENKIGRPLTLNECQQLIEEMRVRNYMIPCTYCYAENKRQAMKDYFNRFMESRRNVLSNRDNYEEAYRNMYGHADKDPEKEISDAAKKVLDRWLSDDPLSQFNPTIEGLVHGFKEMRSIIMNQLDRMLEEKKIDVKNGDVKTANIIAKDLGLKVSKGPFLDKNAIATISNIVNEWRYDIIEGNKHKDIIPGVPETAMRHHVLSAALWNEMCAYGKSASSAKNSLKYYPYTNELQKISNEDRDYINGMGGLRMHSTNDFRIDYTGDYFQLIADMAKHGWFGHTYTKSPEFVRIFGRTGYRINMSCAAYDGPNGEVMMNAHEGFDWRIAEELRRLSPNAGMMMMTTSINQLTFALNDPRFDMIIPFHASGLPKEVWYNMRAWEDAQHKQNETYYNTDYKKKYLMDNHSEELTKRGVKFGDMTSDEISDLYFEITGKKKPLFVWEKKNGEWNKKPVAPHFLPGETKIKAADPSGVPGKNTKISIPGHGNDLSTYRALCEEYGVHPRFYGMDYLDETSDRKDDKGRGVRDVTEHPNYMKLVKETARTDSPQEAIKFNLDEPSELTEGMSPLEWSIDQMRKLKGSITREENAGDPYGVVDAFMKNTYGKNRPLNYITKEGRQMWTLAQKAVESQQMTDEQLAEQFIPYHPYDKEMYSLKEREEREKSDAFKKWFGDWEGKPKTASKVVDENGRPMVVHHGTPAYGFTVFSNTGEGFNGDNIGAHFGSKKTASEFGEEGEIYNVYLDIKKPYETFDFFADIYDNAYLDSMGELVKEIGTPEARQMMLDGVKKIYTLADPKDLETAIDESFMDVFPDDEGLFEEGKVGASLDNETREKTVELYKKLLKLGGYDGIKYENWYEGDANNICWVALDPRQIKSADTEGKMANNGEFDGRNPDLRYSLKAKELNSDYMSAVNAGDRKKAQRLYDEAAKDVGMLTDENGKLIDLYHGTGKFGFTTFKTHRPSGAIFTTNKRNVSANYGGRDSAYAGVRNINKPYVESDTAEGIIENAKNVLGQDWRLATEEERTSMIDGVEKQAKEIAKVLEGPEFADVEFDPEISDDVMWVQDMIYTAAYGRENGNEGNSMRDLLQNGYEHFTESKQRIREYVVENYDNIGESELNALSFLTGYKLGDVAIDAGLSMAKAFSEDDIATVTGESFLMLGELNDAVKRAKDIGSYHMYGNLGDNPLVVDAKGKNWYNLDFEGMSSTDQIAEWAKDHGYTSVRFKDIHDYGDLSDVYVFYDSSQLKSADAITYDNNGNPIPLTERLDASKGDIRYSMKDDNQTKSDAFKAWFGDWEKDPSNSSKIVDDNGAPLVMYHRTDAEFNTFEHGHGDGKHGDVLGEGFYFGYEPEKKFGKNEKAVYLNVRNPYDASNGLSDDWIDEHDDLLKNVLFPGYKEHPYYMEKLKSKRGLVDLEGYTRDYNLIKKLGFDGIVYEGGWFDDAQVLVFDANQIKSATDNNGNFDPSNPDIRYSLKTDNGRKLGKNDTYKDFAERILSINKDEDDNPDDPNTPSGGGRKKKYHKKTGWTGNYGVAYQGSKNKIVDELIDVLPKGKRFVDLFSGGGAMSHAMALSGNYESVHMNDKAPFGQQLFLDAIDGKYHDYNRKVSREEFYGGMQYTSEGLMHSYNGNGRSYAADSEKRSKAQEQIDRVKALEKLKPMRDKFTSSELDYRDVEIGDGDVLYADIPYEGTGNTSYSKAGAFDMKAFTDWAAKLDRPVYVSSFEAPEGFTEVWSSKEQPGFRAGSRKVEKLFVQDRFAEEERKRIEKQQPRTAADGAGARYSLKRDEQIHSDNFKRWFGDWEKDPENASKVVYRDGSPMVVYHGSNSTHSVFKGDAKHANNKNTPDGAFFFSNTRAGGESYTRYSKEDVKFDGSAENGGVYPVYLDIKKPLVVDFEGRNWRGDRKAIVVYNALDKKNQFIKEFETKDEADDFRDEYRKKHPEIPSHFILSDSYHLILDGHKSTDQVVKEAMESGKYDGVIIKNVVDYGVNGTRHDSSPTDDYVVFSSEQIKSATENNGEFDPNNPDIRYSLKSKDGSYVTNGITINDSDPNDKFSENIISGKKTVETRYSRNRNLDRYAKTGERVALVRSGVNGKANAYATAIIGEPYKVTSKEEWDAEYKNHRVPKGSEYDWKEDTREKWLYPLKDVEVLEDEAKPDKWYPSGAKFSNDDAQYSLKDPLKDNPWTAEAKHRSTAQKAIDDMNLFISSLWQVDVGDVKGAVNELTKFVNGKLYKELGIRIGSARIRTLLNNINKAAQSNDYKDLRDPVRTIQKMLNEAEIELAVGEMVKVLGVKLQKKDQNGVAVARLVDNSTRTIYDAIRSTYQDMMTTEKDREIIEKGKEISAKHKDLLEKLHDYGIDPNSWNGADYKGKEWDNLTDAEKDDLRDMRKEYGRLENERQQLKQDREDIMLGQKLIDTFDDLRNLRQKLEDKEADSLINPDVKFTDEDKDMLYVALPMRERMLKMREHYAELRDLQEEWKKELEKVRTITGTGSRARKEQQRLIAYAAEDAFLKKQKEIVSSTHEISAAMKNILGQGAERLKAWREEQALHKGHVIRMGLDDYGRVRPLMKGEKPSMKQRVKNMLTAISDFWDMPIKSLNFVLQNDQNHLSGEGNLYRYFFLDPESSVVTAWDRKRVAVEDNGRELDAIVGKIWKQKMSKQKLSETVMNKVWAGLDKIDRLQALNADCKTELDSKVTRYLSEEEVDNNNKHKLDGRTDWSTDDTFDEPMTKGHALYIWLTWRQADGKVKLAKMGYNEDSIDQIEKALGPEYIKFGEWLTGDFLPRLREQKYNPRHVELFNTELANNPNYFPLKISQDDLHPQGGIEDNMNMIMPGIGTSNLKERVRNTHPIDAQADAIDVLADYLENMEQWYAMSPVIRDFNALHASTKFKKAMEASHKGSFKALMEAAQTATNTQPKAVADVAGEKINKAIGALMGAGARSHIAFRGMTAVKQLLSYPAYTSYAMDGQFQFQLVGYLFNPVGSMKWAKENLPAYRERASKGDMGLEGLRDIDDMSAFAKRYGEIGMAANKAFDQWAVAAGSRAVYNCAFKRKMNELHRANLSGPAKYSLSQMKAIAHAWAVNEAEICYNQSQQSSRNEFSSPMQKSGNPFLRAFALFQNANISYRRNSLSAMYDLWKMATRDVTEADGSKITGKRVVKAAAGATYRYLLYGAILHAMWQFGGNTNNATLNWTDDDKKGYIRSILLGMFTNGTVFGAPISSYANGYDYTAFEMFKDAGDFVKTIKKEDLETNELELQLFGTLARNLGGVNIETWENILEGSNDLLTDGGGSAEKALDFMTLLCVNKNDRKGWSKYLMTKYGPTEFADGYVKAERSKAKSDKTNDYANEWVESYDSGFHKDMMAIGKYKNRESKLMEEYKKDVQQNGANVEELTQKLIADRDALMQEPEFLRLKPFIQAGGYEAYEALMKSVRANIRYHNPEGAPANEGTQKIGDEKIMSELDKVRDRYRELIK